MLKGINPLLTGDLLALLDQMGHSDTVVITDAHFPAYRLSEVVIELGVSAPEATAAVCSVLDLDNVDAATLMDSGGPWNQAQTELVEALGPIPKDLIREVDRYSFYDLSAKANFIIRTTETRIYANVILSKGVTLG